jgi:hypothetical protein
MPSLEEIEEFKSTLNSLGNEPEILSERGESIEDVRPPEASDLSSLLDGLDLEDEASEEPVEEDTGPDTAEGPEPDIDEDSAGDTGEAAAEPFEGSEEGDAALSELFDGLDIPEDSDDLTTDAEEDTAGEPEDSDADLDSLLDEAGAPTAEEEPADDFDDIDALLAEFGDEESAEGMDLAADEGEEPEGDEEAVAEAPSDAEEFGPAEEAAPPEEPAAADELDDFALPDIFDEEDTVGGEPTEEPLAAEEFDPADLDDVDVVDEADVVDEVDAGTEETEPAEELSDFDEMEEVEDFSIDDLSAENLFTADEALEEEVDEAEEAESEEELPDFGEDTESAGIDALMAGEDELDLGSDLEIGDELDADEDSGEFDLGDLSVSDDFALEDDSGPAGFDESEETAEAIPGGDEAGESLDVSEDLGLEDDDLDLGDDDFEVDEFDLGELGEQFGILEEAGEADEEFAEGPAIDLPSGAELPPGDIDLEITEEEFEQVRQTLETLPRNLKIAVEELIAETGAPPADLRKLLDALASGASARDIANLYTKITGKKIQIPTQYEKRTGEEFEAEKGTLAYAFRQNILPMLRIFLAAATALALLITLGYNFVYRPLYAASLYNTGYEEVMEDRYRSGNRYFEQAFDTWRDKNQFYRFADGFTRRGQYEFASRKYEELDRAYPDDRRGILEHARLQRDKIADYERAESLLKRLLEEEMGDTEAMLELGDTYLEWGDEDSEKYEDARFWYAEYRRWKGDDEAVSYRFARYFIRTDKPEDVLRYRDHFLAADRWKVDPVAYAEIAGYLLDRGHIEKIKDLLFKARDARERTPEVHYQLARYFRRTAERGQEMLALTKADTYFREQQPLRPRSLAMFIDTQNRIGRHFYENEEYLRAQERFVEGIDLYENARKRGYLGPAPNFGELYANVGAIDYYVAGDYDSALRNFTLAEENQYTTPELSYRKGYVHYRREEFGEALLEFYEASEGFSDDPNLMLATANTLYNRRDFFAAQGFYNHVLDILEDRKNRAPFILPQERRDHFELITSLKETHNNIGVTLYNLYRQGGSLDAGKYSQALVHLSRSSEYYDLLTRDPRTLERVDTKNLGYLNQKALLVPMEESPMELQAYPEIPKDMQG